MFTGLDKRFFLNINVWEFSYLSLLREYAHLFFLKAMLPHPLKTFRGIRKYQDYIKNHRDNLVKFKDILSIPDKWAIIERIKKLQLTPLVGFGFCLKPYFHDNPSLSCPSGRANHDCLHLKKGKTYSACLTCEIHKIAKRCLYSGWGIYIMTSAKDIALDFLIPQIKSKKFPSAILFLCPYSIQVIIPVLLICEIEMILFPYSSGFCQDYTQWLKADRGIKAEKTTISQESNRIFHYLQDKVGKMEHRHKRFIRQGNIYFPK